MTAVKSEKQWQAESDAQTLLNAETVRQDPARMRKAKVPLAKLVKESRIKAQAGSRLLKKQPISKSRRSKKWQDRKNK